MRSLTPHQLPATCKIKTYKCLIIPLTLGSVLWSVWRLLSVEDPWACSPNSICLMVTSLLTLFPDNSLILTLNSAPVPVSKGLPPLPCNTWSCLALHIVYGFCLCSSSHLQTLSLKKSISWRKLLPFLLNGSLAALLIFCYYFLYCV